MIIFPNYTFSVPDKLLYTLYKGITVTLVPTQASSMSSYGHATFTRGASCLCFVRRPFTRLAQPRVTAPLRPSQGHRRTAPSAPKQPTTLPCLYWASEASRLDAPECARCVVLLACSHLRCRWSASFGIAEGESYSCETTLM
jgi:hypothetical protein